MTRIWQQIFPICLNASVSENFICKKCRLRVNENATFIVHVKHPFDLQANNIVRTFTRENQFRFYEAVRNDSEDIRLSSEMHVEKKKIER